MWGKKKRCFCITTKRVPRNWHDRITAFIEKRYKLDHYSALGHTNELLDELVKHGIVPEHWRVLPHSGCCQHKLGKPKKLRPTFGVFAGILAKECEYCGYVVPIDPDAPFKKLRRNGLI